MLNVIYAANPLMFNKEHCCNSLYISIHLNIEDESLREVGYYLMGEVCGGGRFNWSGENWSNTELKLLIILNGPFTHLSIK